MANHQCPVSSTHLRPKPLSGGHRGSARACTFFPHLLFNTLIFVFRRDLIEPTGPTAPTGPTCGCPAVVYHFRSRAPQVADPYAILRPPAATTRGWRCPAMPHLGRDSMIKGPVDGVYDHTVRSRPNGG